MQLHRVEESFANWKRLLEDREVRIPLNPIVVDSWRRSRDANIDSEGEQLPLERVPDTEFQRELAEHEDVLKAAAAQCHWFSAMHQTIPHTVYVMNAAGVVLFSNGTDLEMVDRFGLTAGYHWGESKIGTTGPGTSLYLDQPLTLFGPEHFHHTLSDHASSGAPVHIGGSLAGCIGFCCRIDDSRPEDLALLEHVTSVVEQQTALLIEIRERTRVEQELRLAQDLAKAANSAKSDILTRISHDLRIPLTAITGFCHILKEKSFLLDERQRSEFLDRIHNNAIYQLTLINGILDLARTESGKTELWLRAFRVDDLIREVVDTIAAGMNKPNVVVKTDLPDFTVDLETDYAKLKQVLINVLHNAIKYTSEGEVIVQLLTDSQGSPRSIQVIDSGPGIPLEALSRIFEPFNEVRRNYKSGTGLGLAISRSLCRAMGFDLTVQSTPGSGSVFCIQFNTEEHAQNAEK